jgi:hypothetical protein
MLRRINRIVVIEHHCLDLRFRGHGSDFCLVQVRVAHVRHHCGCTARRPMILRGYPSYEFCGLVEVADFGDQDICPSGKTGYGIARAAVTGEHDYPVRRFETVGIRFHLRAHFGRHQDVV